MTVVAMHVALEHAFKPVWIFYQTFTGKLLQCMLRRNVPLNWRIRFVPLAELVDASLLEFSDEYAPLSVIQEPKWRVRALLTKLESDRKNSTDFFSHKFMAKVSEIFAGLPKPKDVRSFEGNDLPLLFTHNEVQTFALEHRLNKAQTKAVDQLQNG